MRHRILSVWVTALGLLGCSGPIFLMPGGALDGPLRATPQDFSFADEAGTIQLETNPSQPYSVNISCAVVAGVLYINAGDTETAWVKNIQADRNVRLRINDGIFELQAHRVTEAAEMDRVAEAWTGKHGWWARDPRELDEAWVYLLEGR